MASTANVLAQSWINGNYRLAETLADLDEPWFFADLPEELQSQHKKMMQMGVIEESEKTAHNGHYLRKWRMTDKARGFFDERSPPEGGPLPCNHPGVENIMNENGPTDYRCPHCGTEYVRSEVDA